MPLKGFPGGGFQVLGFSKQDPYRWRANPATERDWGDSHLVNAALDMFADGSEFGYRFITYRLPERGGLNRPSEPMHGVIWWSGTSCRGTNKLWLTVITEPPTTGGKLYLCVPKDVYSGRIVGYSMDSRMKSNLAVAAFESAVRVQFPVGTVVRSGPGSQFLGPPLR